MWEPGIALTGNPEALKVSASDVAATGGCGRFLAAKVRPGVRAAGWQRTWGRENVFALGLVADLVLVAHEAEEAHHPPTLRRWLNRQFDSRRTHRLLRRYVGEGVENVLDAHADIEHELGTALRLLAENPGVGRYPSQLTVWAPLYESHDERVREIRRYRLGGAHPRPERGDELWTATAGYVAAMYRPAAELKRVRVVEVGVGDGSSTVVAFDGTPQEAVAHYKVLAQQRVRAMAARTDAAPGLDCGSCKVAGVCDALVPVTGMLGQPRAGYASRSVAATDLERYRRCPAQWLLDRELHLPREDDAPSEAQARGTAVHRWLEAAHRRGVGCGAEDLPEPETVRRDADLGMADGVVSVEEYTRAHPFLVQHLANCPLHAGGSLVAVEEDLHGFDHDAQVVAVARPDLVYRNGDRLVAREVKTSGALPEDTDGDGGRAERYRRHLQIPFTLALLAGGVAERYGAAAATVELELLTPHGSRVWAWHSDEPATARAAADDVRQAVADWHDDATWPTRPGPQCAWCPVRRWCPDNDRYTADVGTTGAARVVRVTDPSEEAPF